MGTCCSGNEACDPVLLYVPRGWGERVGLLYQALCIHTVNKYGDEHTVWVSTISTLSTGRQGPCRPVFKKIARLVGQIGPGSRLMGTVRVRSPSTGFRRVRPVFKKNARLVGRLWSGPRLVADVVPANRVNRPTGPRRPM